MFLRPLTRVIAALFLSTLLALAGVSQTPASDTPPGLQMEFPAGGHLRIENQLGNVTAESWNQKHVFVSASGEAGVSRLSSVVIENGSQGFVIRVTRKPGAPDAPVDLSIKFPDTAQVEIQTGGGQVSLRGIPASATVKSIAGDVNVEFPESANLDIVARANQGAIKSELPQPLSENGHLLKAKLGDGTQALNVNSETGNITLSLLKDFGDRGGKNPPEPAMTDVPIKGAGTPAPVLDAQDVDEGDVIRVDSQLATLNLSVIDRNTNRGLPGLTQSDFRLFENGAPQEILQFDSSSAPFDLQLVIDLSGSTRDVLKLIRAAALRFVDAARPSDRIGVITFAGKATLVSPLTLDRQTLHERINVMDTAAGDTKLYDALDFAVNESEKNAKSRRRTAIIVMSDGLDASMSGVARGPNDVGSKLSYKDLLSRVGEFDGVVYTLWLNTEYEALNPHDTQPEAFDAGHDRMKETADLGGGIFYEVERLEDLAGAYERVVADLGTVYSLAYRPADKARDGKWRAIRVNVVTRPSAIARGKRGYYAN
ncbi:MAG TPA: VWA domain-containing protein [Pyrinomonadaceae bacterium]|jgi:VWFA-related protein|nr:VWA domain-containing protein [Pyrinomonadaceae bacterium]